MQRHTEQARRGVGPSNVHESTNRAAPWSPEFRRIADSHAPSLLGADALHTPNARARACHPDPWCRCRRAKGRRSRAAARKARKRMVFCTPSMARSTWLGHVSVTVVLPRPPGPVGWRHPGLCSFEVTDHAGLAKHLRTARPSYTATHPCLPQQLCLDDLECPSRTSQTHAHLVHSRTTVDHLWT